MAAEPAAAPGRGSPRLRWARRVLALAAVVGVGLALLSAVEDAGEVALPGVGRLLVAGGFVALGVLAAGAAWAVLVPGPGVLALLPGFLLAQLARYVPGSVWQGVGQVLDAHRLGVGRGAASVAFVVQLATQLVGAGLVGTLAVLRPELGGWRWAALAGVLPVVLLWRPLLTAVLRLATRLAPRRLGHLPDTLPSQLRILAATGFGVVTALVLGLGFAVLLPDPSGLAGLLGAVGVFAAAWVVGFLVVPLPAGLGVRELVLVVGLTGIGPSGIGLSDAATTGAGAVAGAAPGALSTAVVLTAAVAHRVVAVVAEVALAAAVWLASLVGRRR